MFRFCRLVLIGLALTVVSADTASSAVIMDVGNQTSTFIGNTRGYWFTAPTSFLIDGIRVVTDASTDAQSVEIVRFTSPPPLFPNTTNSFTSLFSAKNVDSTGFITTGSILVNSGDVIGVLGVRGNGVNSYQDGPYVSSIFGNSVILERLGMQSRLETNPVANLFTEDSPFGRVELLYSASAAVPEPSSLAVFGFGAWVFGVCSARRQRQSKR